MNMSEISIVDSAEVLLLWWIAVALTALVIVPLALILLHTTLRKAISIRRFTSESLEAARGILGNVGAASALEDTLSAAGPLVPAGGRLAEKSERLADVLTRRAEH